MSVIEEDSVGAEPRSTSSEAAAGCPSPMKLSKPLKNPLRGFRAWLVELEEVAGAVVVEEDADEEEEEEEEEEGF